MARVSPYAWGTRILERSDGVSAVALALAPALSLSIGALVSALALAPPIAAAISACAGPDAVDTHTAKACPAQVWAASLCAQMPVRSLRDLSGGCDSAEDVDTTSACACTCCACA